MSRQLDWSPVGYGSDPTPGDPAVVRDGGRAYSDVADRIARCAQALRDLDAGESQAESVKALLETRDELVSASLKAEGRYRETGAALGDYAQVLSRVQQDTANALSAAHSAAADVANANRMVGMYQRLADGLEDGEEDQARVYAARENEWRQDAREAQGVITSQVQVIQSAVADRDAAAQTAIDRIQAATTGDGLDDTWWEDWGSKVTAWVTTISEWVATIAGILALVVCWIPVIGQALAAGLLAIAAIAGIIAAIGNILQAAHGEKSWMEAAFSVVFAALGCVGLGGLRGAAQALKGLGGLKAAWAAAGGATALGGVRGVMRAFAANAKNSIKAFAGGVKKAMSSFATAATNRLAGVFDRLRSCVAALDETAEALRTGSQHMHTGSAQTQLDNLLAQRDLAISTRDAAKAQLLADMPKGYSLADFSRGKIKATVRSLKEDGIAPDLLQNLINTAETLSTSRYQVTQLGEHIGVIAGQDTLTAHGYQVISDFSDLTAGPRSFDGLALTPDGGTMVFPEFKGMSAQLSTHQVTAWNGNKVVQGTPEYLMDLMLKDGRMPQFLADNPAVWDRITSGAMNYELAVFSTPYPGPTKIINAQSFTMDPAVLKLLTPLVENLRAATP